MAIKPKVSTGSRLSNIIGRIRGNFDFNTPTKSQEPVAYGSNELISQREKTAILSRSLRVTDNRSRGGMSSAGIMGIVQTSLSKVGKDRLENRKILQLMPEVNKAAKLMIASSFSPTDLAKHDIKVIFDNDSLDEGTNVRLSEVATTFFQKKLNLKTAAPQWVYQWGYESGSTIFAIIPLRAFKDIQDSSFMGRESFIQNVVNPIAEESIFGFGDGNTSTKVLNAECIALESFGDKVIHKAITSDTDRDGPIISGQASDLIKKILATESLSLTDNPSILQVNQISKTRAQSKATNALNNRYLSPISQPVLSISGDIDSSNKDGLIGDPILMRLPPESVTVIHTPGDPSDHQGYLVLLNQNGNPINIVESDDTDSQRAQRQSADNGNIFNQVYNAYGINSGTRGGANDDTMNRIYTQIISEHLHNRINKAGYYNVEIGNSDSIFRCMFARFLQAKQTRVLFLPKDLVSYMTFEMDQYGYGVSRLERIKFMLGMKMAVQISRVLASVKAAMDKRKIEVRFTENMMEQPEAIFQDVIREYLNKSTMSFSIDPNVIQNQIADKSVSIKGIDIPGMEQFDLTNEADQRSSSVDFDPDILNYLDKGILNGLDVPAATMNALSEDEYSRSVTTTNLFFSMNVSLDQDIIIKCVSDLIRKYAKYSPTFRNKLLEAYPILRPGEANVKTIDDIFESNVTMDSLIESMLIGLPKPNVAPSKAQFESLESMTSAITALMTAILPDELIGVDDTLAPTLRLLRSKFTSMNIKAYLDGSGMSDVEVPDNNFAGQLTDLSELMNALKNVDAMLRDKLKIESETSTNTDEVSGY